MDANSLKMTQRVLAAIFFLLLSVSSNAQFNAGKQPYELMTSLDRVRSDSERIQTLLSLTYHYLFKLGDRRDNLDSALIWLKPANGLIGNTDTRWQPELNCFYGKYYLKAGDYRRGKSYIDSVAIRIGQLKNTRLQLEGWRKLSYNIPAYDTIGLSRAGCLRKVAFLHLKMGDTLMAINTQKDIADAYLFEGNLERAEQELLIVLEKYKRINLPNLHHVYNLLAVVNNYKGEYNKSLDYALLTVESMEKTKDTSDATNFYSRLANIYFELGETEKSIIYFKKVFNKDFTLPIGFYTVREAGLLARQMTSLGQGKEALDFISNFAKKYPPMEAYGKASLARTLAYCYSMQGDQQLWEKYSLVMIELAPRLGQNNEIRGEVEYDIGEYYLKKGQFESSITHFNIALEEAILMNAVNSIKNVHYALYKAESALGNYPVAIQHLNLYHQLKDSIFNETKSRQIEEVQVKYETEKKEQNIKLLEKEATLQQSKLLQEKSSKNWILAGAMLLLIITGLLINNARVKSRTNKKLEHQQSEIQQQNMTLQNLLKEKEWLVKEIHHRVKNNFHIVQGLLGTQSGYLKSEEAINALADSRHRVQAMSLIHQRLYQSDNMSAINMAEYIHELVSYLRESFNTQQAIQFKLEVDPIEMDLSHCIPFGLIVNEVITNSIKYAFPDTHKGIIEISFKRLLPDLFALNIADNGIGLPVDFDLKNPTSMGMRLIQGLSEDLDATFTLTSDAGTKLKVEFSYAPENSDHYSLSHSEPSRSL